ncbi:serine hydrolase [Myxacorys almedinensis A]|uniref:Serine hydrolase n=2 Tax=Myxacorys TaxID=2056239 RepID=A0A8J8CP77_9CYAN|nr:serine hydrolase [Myxacorys almedinensis A]
MTPLGNSSATHQPRRSSRPTVANELRPTRPLTSRLNSPSTRRDRPPAFRPRTASGLAILYGTRLLILGVGIGVLAGTILSAWDPATRFSAEAQAEKTDVAVAPSQPALPLLKLSEEIVPLKAQVQAVIGAPRTSEGTAPLTQLTPGVMVVDLDTHTFLDINASNSFAAASTIKVPVLAAFFQEVDAGKIRLDEMLTMRPDLIATEAGDLQYQPPGSRFLALEVVTKMITVSDNTATNMIIDRLGGKDALNQRFQTWGLTHTAIRNPLPDLGGTNTTSPKDMATLMSMINSGQMVSSRSQARMLDMMRNVVTDSLLPRGLGEGATIAHKTGDIGSLVGDIGMVDMPSGKRYVIGVLVKRPHNDDNAQNLIRQISTLTYQYFERSSQPAPQTPATEANPHPGSANPASPAPANPAVSPSDPQGASIPRLKSAQSNP